MSSTYPYRYSENFAAAGLGDLDTSFNYKEFHAGDHNNVWHTIAREGAGFMRGRDNAKIGALAVQLRADGYVAGKQFADALERIPSPDAYVSEEKLTTEWLKGFVHTYRSTEYDFAQVSPEAKYDIPEYGGFAVLMDEANKPLLLEQNNLSASGSSSALSLREIVVDGIPYPPGFIFGVVHPYHTQVRRGQLSDGRTALAASALEMPHLQPRRATTWSVPVDERKEIFGDLMAMHNAEEVGGLFDTNSWEMSDFEEVVGAASFESKTLSIATKALRKWEFPALQKAA